MKRFLIFLIFSPPIVLAIFLVHEATIPNIGFVFLTLGYSFPMAAIPASTVAAVDWALLRAPLYLRMTVTMIFATLLAEFIGNQLLGLPVSLAIGLMGAVPAAVCSWLSDKSVRSQNA